MFGSDRFWSAFGRAGMLDEITHHPEAGPPVVFQGGFARPDQVVLDGMVHTTDYSIEYQAADIELKRGAAVSILGVDYKVRQTPAAKGDGAFFIALLEKVEP